MRRSPSTLCVILISVAGVAAAVLVSPGNTSLECRRWYPVLEDLQTNLFDHGRCNDNARRSIRITFHDAIGYSAVLWSSGKFGGGGADGSLIKFADIELAYMANKGLDGIVHSLKRIADKHKVNYGDLIQFAGAVGLSNCPGAPRLAFFAGRSEAVAPSPPDLFPAPTDAADTILARMEDAGLNPDETVALLGSHSIGKKRITDPAVPGMSLDSTPNNFDSQFYLEVLLKGKGQHAGEPLSASRSVFRLASDAAIAHHPRTACAWQSYIGRDDTFRTAFQRAMFKLANLGHDPQLLVDCSSVVPVPPPSPSNATTHYPPHTGPENIEQTCPGTFPKLPH